MTEPAGSGPPEIERLQAPLDRLGRDHARVSEAADEIEEVMAGTRQAMRDLKKKLICAGAVGAIAGAGAGLAVWLAVILAVPEQPRSVSWYMQHPAEFAADARWCWDHPISIAKCQAVSWPWWFWLAWLAAIMLHLLVTCWWYPPGRNRMQADAEAFMAASRKATDEQGR